MAIKVIPGIQATQTVETEEVGAEKYRDSAPRQTARSLRILIVATEAPPVRGGIARVIGYLQEGLQQQKHYVDVLAYPEVKRLVFGQIRLSSLIFRLPQLMRSISEFDVIHVHGTTPTVSDVMLLFLRIALRRRPRPLVVYTHYADLDFGPWELLNKAYNCLHHWLSSHADAVIAATPDILELTGKNKRGFVVPLGIDLKHFAIQGQKDSGFTVLFVGQFRPYKGVPILMRAMAQVPGARLLLVGRGPEEQAYRSLARELGLDTEFHVSIDDVQLRQFYQRAHVVVLPSVSRLEAFGLVLVEGMAAGCIPIASDLPGVREVVGLSGFLFPQGNVNRLASILRSLRDDAALVQQMGERARMRATEFDKERTSREYEKIIENLFAELVASWTSQEKTKPLSLQDEQIMEAGRS